MDMKFGTHNFEIFITGEDPLVNTRLLAFPKFKLNIKIRKNKEGSEVRNVKLAVVSMENKIIEKLKKDEDIRQEFMDEDNEIDLELTGKLINRTSRLLFNEAGDLCYNFTEYEVKKDRQGRVVPCETCGELYCEHRIKKRSITNVDVDEKPIVYYKPIMMDKLEAIKKWSFDRSYQIRHKDGLQFQFCYDLAKKLHESGKMVLMAPIEAKLPQKIVIKNGSIPFFGWLEGRIKGDKYALILHRTTLKIVE